MNKLKKNDLVVVISGRDKGKQGKIIDISYADGWVRVSGVNVVKRHSRPSQKNPAGGIVSKEAKLNLSKVLLLDSSSGKPARVAIKVNAQGEKTRVFKKSKHSV